MASNSKQSKNSSTGSLTERLPELNTKYVATAVGVAAAVVAGAIAARAVRGQQNGSGDQSSIFHLRQDGDSWLLELEGSSSPEGTYPTKREGLTAARELAHKCAPCELVVYRTDGTVQDRHAYEEN